MLKLIYSEKATKFCKIFPLLLTGTTKAKGKISQNFVAFSEYMNFNRICLTLKLTICILFDYRVYDIEERIKTPRKFRFPQFEPVNWLAALKLKNDLSDLNSDSTLCPSHLLSGIKALLQALKLWLPDLETKVFSKLLLFIGIVYSDTLNWNFLKFIYSEKGIKILWNLHLTFDWHYIGQK